MKQEICVGDQEGGLRIDKYLAEAAGQLSPLLHPEAFKGRTDPGKRKAGKSKLCG